MTIIEAIHAIDSIKPNGYSQSDKVRWLSMLDGLVKAEIIDTHEGADKETAIIEYIRNSEFLYQTKLEEYAKVNEVSIEEAREQIPFQKVSYKDAKEHIEKTRPDIMFSGYDDNTPLDTVLLIPAPYDNVYVLWLQAQIDYANEDTAKYKNSSSAYNHAYNEFQRYYNRTHMPCSQPRKYF
jgi:hypothetical protein